MRKIKLLPGLFLFIVLSITIITGGCEEDEPEIVPQNGRWEWKSTGTYADEVWFIVDNGKIKNSDGHSIGYKMVFDNWSITWSCMGCEISINNGSFKYENGTLSSGKVTITGKFSSSTSCKGKVTYEEDSFTREANGSFEYNAALVQ